MKPFLLAAALPLLALTLVQSPVAEAGTSPDTYMAKACPAGTVWDQRKEKCVPRRPRGSYGGSAG